MDFMEMAMGPPPAAGPPASGGSPPTDARPPETTSVTVRVAGPLTVASAKGSHADIASVTITVTEKGSETQVATAELTRSPAGVWTGTLSGLTVGKELTFTATALDSEGTKIFTGAHSATLNSAGAQITIRLSAVDDGVTSALPKITAISIANVSTGVAAEVTITVSGSSTETLDFEFAGDAFTPKSGSVTLSAGAGTITSSYAAPSVPGWYAAQVVVRNAQGHRIQADFQIRVQTSGLSATLGPAVLGVTGRRTPAGIRWFAEVSAAGDGAVLTYAWRFTKTAGTAVSFTDAAANPAMMTGYAADTAGTVSVTVSDADSLTSTASVNVPAGLFPDLPLAPPKAVLLVNEIDYDQDGSSDNAEFIEILNPGSGAVDLSLYRVELVDGVRKAPYKDYELTGSLAAGAFLVIADQKVFDDNAGLAPPGTDPLLLTGSGIQNGPDVVRIVAVADDRIVDAVQYERVVPGLGEGSAGPEDPAAETATSIGRCPNGFDSDDNGVDFRTMTATPGAANTCSS